jgi:hypothetical protein
VKIVYSLSFFLTISSTSDYVASSPFFLVLERSQFIFEGYLNAGTATKQWFAIFSLLQRLRQACDHVSLTIGKMTETSELKCEDETVEPSLNGDANNVVDDNVSDSTINCILDHIYTYLRSSCLLPVPAKFTVEVQNQRKWS